VHGAPGADAPLQRAAHAGDVVRAMARSAAQVLARLQGQGG
jgi:hypothetical protein